MTASAAAPRFLLLGLDDETTVCELCGKADLKCTMVLSQLDEDGNEIAIVRYGRDCGNAALGWKVSADRAEKLAKGIARFTYDQLYGVIQAGDPAGRGGWRNAGETEGVPGTIDGVAVQVCMLWSRIKLAPWNMGSKVGKHVLVWRLA